MKSPTDSARRFARALWCAALLVGAALNAHAADAPPAPAAPLRFDILEYVVEGDTVLGNAAIERAVYPFLGPSRSVADAEAARQALEKAYQDAGFLSVSVVLPPQRVGAGSAEVRLQVVEASVARLRITGAEFHLPSRIREALPAIAPGTVPNFNEMQQQLTELSRSVADTEVTPLLSAGTQAGRMDVELKVQDSVPLHASVEANGKQSTNTAAGRIEAAVSYDNLFQRGHSVGFNWFYSPRRPDQANIQSFSYSVPAGGGDRVTALFTHSDSNTPTPLGGGTVSRGDTGRLRWRGELPSRVDISQALTWGLTLRHLQDSNEDVAGVTTTTPSLRYPTLNLDYELNLGSSVPGRNSRLQAAMTVSLPGLSARQVDCNGVTMDQFACKRSAASARFQVLNLTLQHEEALARWTVMARLQGQWADSPLVPAEQVVYGGTDSARGYYEGEQAGDLGLALRLELGAPRWAPADRWSLQGIGFFDRALVHKLEPLAAETATVQLGSAGLGLRLSGPGGLQATLDWARLLYNTAHLDSFGQSVPLSGSAAGDRQRWDLALRKAF